MKRIYPILVLTLSLFGVQNSAFAGQCAGVKLQESATLDGRELVLNGLIRVCDFAELTDAAWRLIDENEIESAARVLAALAVLGLAALLALGWYLSIKKIGELAEAR